MASKAIEAAPQSSPWTTRFPPHISSDNDAARTYQNQGDSVPSEPIFSSPNSKDDSPRFQANSASFQTESPTSAQSIHIIELTKPTRWFPASSVGTPGTPDPDTRTQRSEITLEFVLPFLKRVRPKQGSSSQADSHTNGVSDLGGERQLREGETAEREEDRTFLSLFSKLELLSGDQGGGVLSAGEGLRPEVS